MIDLKDKKTINLLLYFAIAIFGFILLIIVTSAISKATKAHQQEVKRTEIVITIDDVKISKDQFICVCRQIIDSGDIDGRFLLSKTNKSIAAEVEEKATKQLVENTYLLMQAEEAGVSLTEREKLLVEADVKSEGNNDYYLENYSVTLAKYIEMAQNKALAQKYINYVTDNIEFTDELLRETYYKNKYNLLGATVNIVFLDKESLGANSVGLDISYDQYINQKATIIESDLKESTTNFVKYDRYYGLPDYSKGSLCTVLTPDVPAKYKDLLVAAIDGEIGKVYCVKTENGYGIFEVVSKLSFDDIKNGDRIRTIIKNNKLSEIYSNAEKYLTAVTKEAYSNVDITEFIQERRNTL